MNNWRKEVCKEKNELNIWETNKRELILENLLKIEINNKNEGFEIIKNGVKNCHIALTNMNKNSSCYMQFLLYL